MNENLEGEKLGCKTKTGMPAICATNKCPAQGKPKRTKTQEPPDSGVKKCSVKLGPTFPPVPLNTANRPEGRIPPTWGSNLMYLKDLSEADDDVHYKTRKSIVRDRQPKDNEAFDLGANLDDAEQFVQEYKKGVLQKKSQVECRRSVVQFKLDEPQNKSHDDQTDDATENEDVDEQTSERIREATDDSYLVDYLRGQSTAKQNTHKGRAEGKRASPALAGIPMTTPRSSPSPRRREKIEKYHQEDTAEAVPFPDIISEDSDDDLEDSSDEDKYAEWLSRLRKLEWECEQQIKHINAQKNQEKPFRNKK